MLGLTQFVMRKAKVVRAAEQIHAGFQCLQAVSRMTTCARESRQPLTHRLDRDTARPHSLRSARFRIPSE
jgi:hypothetical protein